MRIFFLSVFSCLFVITFGQTQQGSAADSPFAKVESRRMGDGTIVIRQSPAIEQMMGHYVKNNKSMPGVEGYRIQMYSGTGAQARQEAQDVRAKMLGLFPNERIMVEYNAPFWRVRVGTYRHKHEALPLLRKLKDAFPNSYVVREPSISLEEFKKN